MLPENKIRHSTDGGYVEKGECNEYCLACAVEARDKQWAKYWLGILTQHAFPVPPNGTMWITGDIPVADYETLKKLSEPCPKPPQVEP
jgi:hypothetical protein